MTETHHPSSSDGDSLYDEDDFSCLDDDELECDAENDCVSDVISVPDVDDQFLDMQMVHVTMPTGVEVEITRPVRMRRKPQITTCTHDSVESYCHLILLRPENAVAAQERAMVANEMMATIRTHSGGKAVTYDILEVHKVQNCCLWTRFRNKRKMLCDDIGDVNERMLFHGTPATENIMKTGFKLKFANKSGMFGPGFYFAEHSSKSNSYCYGLRSGGICAIHLQVNCKFCQLSSRKMLLCRVMLGNSYILTQSHRMDGPPPGFHSVSGKRGGALRYPEYVVYNEDQIYPEYLITYKIVTTKR